MAAWRDYSGGFDLRGYQRAALDRFDAVQREGKRRSFYLVAPPGSGKTLLGLTMAERLGEPAVCLSPTTTIAAQWVSRLEQHWMCLDSALEAFEPKPPAGLEPSAQPRLLISLTNQRIAVSTSEGVAHPNVLELRATLRRLGIRTVIVDECHHLSGTWGEAVEALLAELEDPFTVGLTATPLDSEDGPLVRLLGSPDHTISLPSVVRSGDLVPFQDLCHVVPASDAEEAEIDAELGKFERLFQELCTPTDDRFSLPNWADQLELEPKSSKGDKLSDVLELFETETDLVVAWCRLRAERGHEPPELLPYLPEFSDELNLGDRLLLSARYVANELLEKSSAAELCARASAVLATWGYEVGPGRVRRVVGRLWETIGFSRQKLEACAAICEVK